MIISCPSCTARFKVDADSIGSDGRVVKCSQCAHVWQARQEDDETESLAAARAAAQPSPPPQPEPEPEPAPEPAPEPEPPAAPPAAPEPETTAEAAPDAASAEEEPPPPPPAPPQPGEQEKGAEEVSSAGLDAAVEGLVGAIDKEDAELSEELAAAAPEPGEMEVEEPEEAEAPEPPAVPAGGESVPPPPPPEPPPIPSRKDLAADSKRGAGRVVAWAFVILVVLVAGMGAGVHFARERLVELFPPLNMVLIQIGLGVPHLGEGLALASPVAELDEQGLKISGFIENKRGEILDIPLLRGALCDANSEEIYVWTFQAEDTRVLPGERISYETVISDAPAGAKDISIGFTTEAEIAAESAANGTGKTRTCR